ncbi:ERMP1 [Bugula neritina]|uniref:ERMP1 n=1 Tax=Bugula neritina TaxID=10212 RepID=A0A7J7KAT6_BUGNE|nr:ERMP1 [Bugula neritina]
MLFIVCPLIIRQISLDLFNIKLHSSPKLYISLTALSLLVPFVHLMQFAHMLNLFFMPLMGRVGSEVNVDVVISLTTLLPVFIISTYLAGFLHVSKDMARLAIKLFVIALIFSLIGCFSSLGFPYSGNLSSPSAQRHVLHNFKRDFYSHDGKLNYSDHGLAYLPFDRNSKSYIEYIPEIEALQNYELDDSLAYGGIPYFFPLVSILPKVYIGPMEKPDISESIEVTTAKN